MILERIVVGPLETNCYVVGDETTGEGIVIDPGDDSSKILEVISRKNLTIRDIINTHCHSDHTGANEQIKKKTNAKILIHKEDAKYINSADMELQEGDKINVGDIIFNVIHTPGHTEGGICLIYNNIIFSGDTLFEGGIGRTDLPGGSYRKIIDSIKNKLFSFPDKTVVYPGHGPSTTIGKEKSSNPYLWSF